MTITPALLQRHIDFKKKKSFLYASMKEIDNRIVHPLFPKLKNVKISEEIING